MRIDKETVSEFRHGTCIVGTSPVKITGVDFKTLKGVMIRAPGEDDLAGGNNHSIFIGTETVTANYDEKTGGFPLPPGNAMVIPVENTGELYAVSTGSNQILSWAVI